MTPYEEGITRPLVISAWNNLGQVVQQTLGSLYDRPDYCYPRKPRRVNVAELCK